MSLPLRHRLLAAAAFATAVATGYVANLDDGAGTGSTGSTGSTDGLAPVVAAARSGAAPAGDGGVLDAPRARGDWPSPSDEAVSAWGPVPTDGRPGAPAAPRLAAAAPNRAATAPAPALATAGTTATEPLPPPPWRWIGRVDDAGSARALLATPQQLRVVAAGEPLDGQWRVERIGAESVELRALDREQSVLLAWEAR